MAANSMIQFVPGIHSPSTVALANAVKMLHTHTIEIRRNHLIRLNMYPIDGLLNAMAAPWLEGYSSIGMKIVNSQHHEIANDYEEFLLTIQCTILNQYT